MHDKFTAIEILKMAEKIEKNGHDFYKKAAADVGEPDIKSFLLELADLELQHEITFQEMTAAFTAQGKAEVVFDLSEETALFLQALADTKVFFEKQIDTSSVREVLRASIVAEKDSIVFYLGIKEMVPDSADKAKIDGIIREEMKHIQTISERLLTLNS